MSASRPISDRLNRRQIEGNSDAEGEGDAKTVALRRAKQILLQSGAKFPNADSEAEALAALAVEFLKTSMSESVRSPPKQRGKVNMDNVINPTKTAMAAPENRWIAELIGSIYDVAPRSVQTAWRADAQLSPFLNNRSKTRYDSSTK
ncbi:MAG: hypothetical protein ABSB53_05150 [Nitrososphaerales archaeon]|jgi:hypothetical protein